MRNEKFKNVVKTLNSITLLLSVMVLSACLGDEGMPVIYIAPADEGSYTTSTLSPEVEFPDGIPSQANTEIRINGVDVSSEFDDWDTVNNKAKILNSLTSGSYPTMLGALREGENTFQVSAPELKEIIFFTMNLAGAAVHVTHVLDNYCGTVFIDSIGNGLDASDGVITDFDCTNYYKITCEHASAIDYTRGCDNQYGVPPTWGTNCLGETIYQRKLVAECLDIQDGTSNTQPYSLSNNTTPGSFDHYTYVRGYFESDVVMTSMNVKVAQLNGSGGLSYYQFSGSPSASAGNTVAHGDSWSDNPMYLHFGASDVSCNGVNVDLQANEFCMMVPDLDVIQIGGIDDEGFGSLEWIKSHVAMKESTLRQGGVAGVRVDETAITSFLDLVSDQISDVGNLLTGSEWIIDPAESPPSFCLGCETFGIDMNSLELKSTSVGAPNLSAPSANVGRFAMDLDLSAPGGNYGLEILGDMYVTCVNFADQISACEDACANTLNNCNNNANNKFNNCMNSASNSRTNCLNSSQSTYNSCMSSNSHSSCHRSCKWYQAGCLAAEAACHISYPIGQAACGVARVVRNAACEVSYGVSVTGCGVVRAADFVACNGAYAICTAGCAVIGGVEVAACNVIIAGIAGPYTLELDATSDIQADLSVDGNYKVNSTTTLPSFDITDLNLSIDQGVYNWVVNLLEPILPFLIDGIVEGLVSDLVTNLVNSLFNVDLPLTMIRVPSVDTEGERQYLNMGLGPEVSSFKVAPNLYGPGLQTLELELGLHSTGKPRLNHSLGNLYAIGAGHNLAQVTTARNNNAANGSTMGLMVHEAFVNQLFMGFWESGILYVDFNTGDDPLVNTFMNNADIKFASASPWTVDILGPGENANGDLKIDVNDLIISFSGDIYDPFQGKWLYDRTVFSLTVELEAYVSLLASNEALGFEFTSNPTVNLLDFYSDYVSIDTALGQSLLNMATPQLVLNTEALEIDIPPIEGLELNIQDLWAEDSEHLAITIDAVYTAP